MAGQYFLDKILTSPVLQDPWQHQIIDDTIPTDVFDRLQSQCQQFLNMDNGGNLRFIFPDEFDQYGIDLYDEVYDIGKTILDNAKALVKDLYTNPRWYNSLTVYAHISITPPLPYKFDIHEEGLEKIWSAVTYVTPIKNIGTKMYSTKNESSFIAEAPWKPNSTFVFCGEKGKTWHSYESSESTNRITLNYFIMSDKRGKRFI
tara:strand:- start:34 stop:642 length:609 start_codon:yes stop_codon:yes gene_type:complete